MSNIELLHNIIADTGVSRRNGITVIATALLLRAVAGNLRERDQRKERTLLLTI